MLIALFFVSSVNAETIEELKQRIENKTAEIKKLEEEASRYRDEIVTTQSRGKTLKGELLRIDKEIAQLRREISLIERKIEKTSLEIEDLGVEIKTKAVTIDKMRTGLAGLIQAVSEKDQKSLLEVIVQNTFLSDFFQQLEYANLIEQKILSSLGTIRELKGELEIKKAQAENKKDELEDLSRSLADQRKAQEVVKKDRNGILKTTQNQEKRYQELLRETEKKQEAILRDIENLEEKLRLEIDPFSLPAQRSGLLIWPTEGVLSQGYGETPFTKSSRGRHFYSFHNGIDISARAGTPIFSVDDGKVRALGDTDRYCYRGAYGKYIVIDHGNNLATMYAHLSHQLVVSGQEVKRGDIIGYMGSTGLSTGPHLHFTLYDARTVEIRLGSIGTCGLLPFGGSLNPLVYL